MQSTKVVTLMVNAKWQGKLALNARYYAIQTSSALPDWYSKFTTRRGK
ncbi:MAG TPA: hypothetical protein PK239_13765 [Chitinophagales bacterium]|nr:hypothetical protein [Chitinophagales bacterium]HRK28337.1 hypothetical protein [Chitinophagales bacterium]